jgi:hypothetical protein
MADQQHDIGPWIDSPEASDAIIAPKATTKYEHEIKDYGGALVGESIAPWNKPLIKAAPSMLRLLEKALPIIEEEAERRNKAMQGDSDKSYSAGEYWTEMRELSHEIAVEIDRAYGREVKHG